MAGLARAFLEWRGQSKGAATVDAIYDALHRGGYSFGNVSASDAKNNLRIAMGKDREVRRLPNGHYGLWDWYPQVRREIDEPAPRRKKPAENGETGTKDNDSAKESSDIPEGEN